MDRESLQISFKDWDTELTSPTAGFVLLLFFSAAAGFTPADYKIPSYKESDKVLHFIAFFLLTLTFYWILETSRRKVLQISFTVCTLGLGCVSEVVQGVLPVSYAADRRCRGGGR